MYKGTELQDEPVDKCNAVGPVSPTPTTPTASALNVASWPAKPPATDTGGGGGGRGGGKENLGAEEALTSLPGADPLRDAAAAAARNRKFPLQRKQSNLTSDSGRSSTSAVAGENLDSVFQNDVDIVRRHSLNCVDSTGHLNVPGGPSTTSASASTGDAGAGEGVGGVALEQQQQPQLRTSASYTALSSSSSSSSPSSPSSKTPATATTAAATAAAGDKPNLAGVSVKRAPKIVYSHSEDRLLTQGLNQRPIIPALPYSPTASPRLRRQPTMETHRVSVSDGDGFTQLNQYRLKDEIGKVSERARRVSWRRLAGLIAALSAFLFVLLLFFACSQPFQACCVVSFASLC